MEKLREKIIKETSGLSSALKRQDDFEIICQIREWVYKTSNIASKRLQSTMHNMGDMHAIDMEKATALYEREMLGSMCGGANIYLSKVYNFFDYRVTTYNFGIEDENFTHEICIVQQKEKNALLLQDAYFNGYFSCDGRPMNFLEAEEIFEKEIPIRFVKGKNSTKTRLQDIHIIPEGDVFYTRTEVKFTWENALRWFEKKNQKHRFSSFFELMKYPLNYDALGLESEKALLSYLNCLSVRYATRYHEIKKKKLSQAGAPNHIRIKLPEDVKEKKRIVLYGIGGYGMSVYNRLERDGIEVHGIIDGDMELSGIKLGDHYIYGPEYLNEIDCDVILVCSMAYKDAMIRNINDIIGKDACIVTLDNMLDVSE